MSASQLAMKANLENIWFKKIIAVLQLFPKKIFGNANQRLIKKLYINIEKINQLEETVKKINNLAEKVNELRSRHLDLGESLDNLLPELFAVVREASYRTLGLRHFDEQLLGGMVLHLGKISEMQTGEGKTLVATLPACLNALSKKGVHIVTINDYLAQRDANWMQPIYDYLGFSVGVNLPNLSIDQKKSIYQSDIVYGTNNEFGFDYLRDHLILDQAEQVQRTLNFAIVDEVDSILIDEARTPLIISGIAEKALDLYQSMQTIAMQLKPGKKKEQIETGDYLIDEKNRQVSLTEKGQQKVEKLLVNLNLIAAGESLYETKNIVLNHYLNNALRANAIYHRDVDYLIKDNQIMIVDEHTGRVMVGRRWSDGLHQAIEAKENVPIQPENRTLATITFQNYFRLYQKLAGMTGTADTEAYEFQQIYHLEVVVIPTHKSVIRKDFSDKIYLSQTIKHQEIIKHIEQCLKNNQPVLVGTTSIENSEHLSQLLTKHNITHQVLNAKFHEQEAKIIAEAGRPGMVTIATNMAGRGTDIILGGNLNSELAKLAESDNLENKNNIDSQREVIKNSWQQRHNDVIKAGGLVVIGSERHDARRIDHQLRGRSGRQGDPGESHFYLSLEDHLLRIFASPKIYDMMKKLGMKENEVIDHPWITKAIERAQRRVESYHFDIRKQLLEYDDVMNEQRQVIYNQRGELLQLESIEPIFQNLQQEIIPDFVQKYLSVEVLSENWDLITLQTALESELNVKLSDKFNNINNTVNNLSIEIVIDQVILDNTEQQAKIKENFTLINPGLYINIARRSLLQILDRFWQEQLNFIDHLRQGIHLRGYAQKNPKQEYKREAFDLFILMQENMHYDMFKMLNQLDINAVNINNINPININFNNNINNQNINLTVARNQACPCGSGQKYRQCHGKLI